MKPRKPCKRCKHKKNGHAWNPNYLPGKEYICMPNFPCQEKYCNCDNYVEMTDQELLEFQYG